MIETAFVGAGNMASAIIRGMLNKGGAMPSQIACTSANDGTGPKLAAATGIRWFDGVEALLRADADIRTVVLAVKPQQFAEIPASVAALTGGKLIVSIMAGMPIVKIGAKFPNAANIVRAMPNTPGQIGEGVTVFAPKSKLSAEHLAAVNCILGSMGPALAGEESMLDAVTGLSGSGPAYVFAFIEALRDGGVAEGLSPEMSYQLAVQTVLGAVKLLQQSGESPESLRKKVTSPKGTTLAALTYMEEHDFSGIVKNAVKAARVRSAELARS